MKPTHFYNKSIGLEEQYEAFVIFLRKPFENIFVNGQEVVVVIVIDAETGFGDFQTCCFEATCAIQYHLYFGAGAVWSFLEFFKSGNVLVDCLAAR